MTGLPNLMRMMGFGFRRPKQPNPGRCLAGTVETVGADVTQLKPDDEVYGTCDGSFAEFARAKVGLLALEPASLSFEQQRRSLSPGSPCCRPRGTAPTSNQGQRTDHRRLRRCRDIRGSDRQSLRRQGHRRV